MGNHSLHPLVFADFRACDGQLFSKIDARILCMFTNPTPQLLGDRKCITLLGMKFVDTLVQRSDYFQLQLNQFTN